VIPLITERKKSHIEICLNRNVCFTNKTTGFNDIELIHNALPEINLNDISLEVEFLGHKFKAPIIISAMTGGSKLSIKINRALAIAAKELGLGMGVGSQRAAIENPELEYTFRIVRDLAPEIFLIANLGAAQFSMGYGVNEAIRAIEMIDANALAIHLNSLQEVVQPEGEPKFNNVLNRLGELSSQLSVPLIAKETGAGISMEVASALERVGVKCIDVGGAGGTSWAAVEYYRALELGDGKRASLARLFWNWGIPTAISICEVKHATKNVEIIATGGIRSGIDAVKALALGASMVGIALPLLKPAYIDGANGVIKFLRHFIEEMKVTMFLVGVKNVSELKSIPLIITGTTAEWLRLRGINLEKYARRTIKHLNLRS